MKAEIGRPGPLDYFTADSSLFTSTNLYQVLVTLIN